MKTWDINKHSVILRDEFEFGGEDMKITMLGTGHAVVTKYYNTCFTIDDRNEYFIDFE